jgi:hypothetical protein
MMAFEQKAVFRVLPRGVVDALKLRPVPVNNEGLKRLITELAVHENQHGLHVLEAVVPGERQVRFRGAILTR